MQKAFYEPLFADELRPDGLQPPTLALYTLLAHLRPAWGGALILSCGLGPLGQAVALAANVAGAACLSIEPDAALCRATMRASACDFLVNTVDEALRVLKNEIRQRRPLSVALELDTTAALAELLDRGVLPQLFTGTRRALDPAILHAAAELGGQGAVVLDLNNTLSHLPGVIEAPTLLGSLLSLSSWEFQTLTFNTADGLKSADVRLQTSHAQDDPRRPWLLAAPRLFHRDRPYRRTAILSQQELTALT